MATAILSGCGASGQRGVIEAMNPGLIKSTAEGTDKTLAAVEPSVTDALKDECRAYLKKSSTGGLFAREVVDYGEMRPSRHQTCLMNSAAAARWQGAGGPLITYEVWPNGPDSARYDLVATCTFELVNGKAQFIVPNFGPSEIHLNGPCKFISRQST